MLAFDASSYFTRRQSDNRYVQSSAVTAAYLAGVLSAGGATGSLPGSLLETGTVTGLQIANQAIGLAQMFGNLRPPAIVTSLPSLPDPEYPVGAQVYLTTSQQLMINRNGTNWESTTRTSDLSGTIAITQFPSSLKPIQPETSLPTIVQDPVTHLPTNFNLGDLIVLTSNSTMYQLSTTGGFNYFWDPVVKATNIDTTSGLITATQINVNSVFAAAVSTGFLKASVESAGIVTVDQLGAGNATIDDLAAHNIQATMANFTTLNGDSANLSYVTAGMVVAAAIDSSKLLIGSFDNLMEDGGVENATSVGSWIPDGQGIVVGTGFPHTGNQSLTKATTTTSTIVNRMVFAVKGADLSNPDTIYLEGWFKAFSGANGNAQLSVQYFTDRACTNSVTPWTSITVGSGSASNWFYANTTGAVPSGARWARVALSISGQTTGTWSVDDLYVRTMVGEAYINSVNANVINAGILNCANISVINLNAASINTGTLTLGGSPITAASISGLDASNSGVLWIGNNGSNSGIWAKNAWFGGTGPSSAQIACVGGSVTISSSTLSGNITAGGSSPTITQLSILNGSNAQIVWAGLSGGFYGLWAQNAWFGGSGPGSASISCVGGTVTIAASTISGTVGSASTAGSASSVPASGVGSGSLNSFTTITGNQITTGTLNANNCNVINLNASNINTGTLNASVVSVINLNASNISTGTLSAGLIFGGTLDCSHITVSNLSVNNLSGWSGAAINVGSFVYFGNGSLGAAYVGVGQSGVSVYNGSGGFCNITATSINLSGTATFSAITGGSISMGGWIDSTQGFSNSNSGSQHFGQFVTISYTKSGGGTGTMVFEGGVLTSFT